MHVPLLSDFVFFRNYILSDVRRIFLSIDASLLV